MTQVPVLSLNDDLTWIGSAYRRAYSMHRGIEHLGAARGQLKHFLVADPRDPARAGHQPRVLGEHAVHVGVDLAHVGAQRRGERDGRGVGAAAAQRGDVLGGLRDALEAGHDRDRALPSSALEMRPGVTSMIRALPCTASVMTPACDPVNDRASMPRLAIAIASSAIEIRSPAVSSMSSSRPGGTGLTRLARSISSSVESPIAETTTTTWSPASRVATMRRATRLMPSASATEEPPYFCTTRATWPECSWHPEATPNLISHTSSSRRPSKARPSVTSSAYSRSPPTGSPLAGLVTRSPSGLTSRAI